MARLYESSTDYQEHINYAGETVTDDYDNPDYQYDRETLAYDGGTTNIAAGYASTTITYSNAATGWNGSKTVTTTANGTGTGTSTTTSVRTVLRTATNNGAGTSTTTRVIIRFRTATGSGTGTSNNTIVHEHLRTGYGSGTATAASIAVGLHTHPRTGSGTGTGTSTNTSRRLYRREASGNGTSSGTATGLRFFVFRPPTDNFVDLTGPRYWSNLTARKTTRVALFRFFEPGPRGRNVWKLTSGTYTENDPDQPDDFEKVYYGGHNNVVDADEKADLVAAGYGDYVS